MLSPSVEAQWLAADVALQGRVRRSKLSRHPDDFVAGLALGAGEILGMVVVHPRNIVGSLDTIKRSLLGKYPKRLVAQRAE